MVNRCRRPVQTFICVHRIIAEMTIFTHERDERSYGIVDKASKFVGV